ncbi:MAG: heme-binding domain-containing protein [Bacteroidetes bacterium]|nr:heme-binding domain-containing protein [Bacteroidota bacterium]
MLKKITKKKILVSLLILLIVCQFIQIDKTIKSVNVNTDLIELTKPDAEIASILKVACYDCHSDQPAYPWYTNIAPFSWWIKHHINEGSHHLNFSEWGNYTQKRKDHKLDECIEMVEDDEMPMTSYTLMHKEAKLTVEQKTLLLNWFKALKEQ